MASMKAVIGHSARVKGRVHGTDDLWIEGRVEGEVRVDGDLTIEASALVAANVSAAVVTVRGAVKGDVVGREAVRLEEGARVVGDLRAPRIAIAPGALVRGHVQTGDAGAAPKTGGRPAAVAASRPAVSSAARSAPVAAARPAPRVAPPPPKVAAKTAAKSPEPKRPAVSIAGGVKAPPPVVPALKKGAKGALKKKA